MTNDTTDSSNQSDELVGCFALSKNDSYVMSASGGKVSLFNMMTFKVAGQNIFIRTYFLLDESKYLTTMSTFGRL